MKLKTEKNVKNILLACSGIAIVSLFASTAFVVGYKTAQQNNICQEQKAYIKTYSSTNEKEQPKNIQEPKTIDKSQEINWLLVVFIVGNSLAFLIILYLVFEYVYYRMQQPKKIDESKMDHKKY